MTGLELLEGLSFVDERFIAEADVASFKRNVPWMKLLSLAACLCILIVGAFALENISHKGETESMKEEAAAPAAPAETMAQAPAEAESAYEEAAPLVPADGITEETAPEKPVTTDELHHIPCATLRIVSVADDHWIAVVEELPAEPVDLEIGMQVKVVIDANAVPGEDREMYGGILLPEEGLLAKIEDGAYDAGANTLYIAGANLEKPTE